MADIIAENLVEEVTAQKDDVNAALVNVPTTVLLADVDAAINTDGKFAGKVVFNSTTGALVVAVGADADDVWNTAAGVAAHTPV